MVFLLLSAQKVYLQNDINSRGFIRTKSNDVKRLSFSLLSQKPEINAQMAKVLQKKNPFPLERLWIIFTELMCIRQQLASVFLLSKNQWICAAYSQTLFPSDLWRNDSFRPILFTFGLAVRIAELWLMRFNSHHWWWNCQWARIEVQKRVLFADIRCNRKQRCLCSIMEPFEMLSIH